MHKLFGLTFGVAATALSLKPDHGDGKNQAQMSAFGAGAVQEDFHPVFSTIVHL